MGESTIATAGVSVVRPADHTPATAETASSAVAAQARASVESRFVMALRKPRNEMDCMNRILEACKRPSFAESARYAKPMGTDFVHGLSIRFAEEVARCWTNILTECVITYDDDKKRLGRVNSTDLESNVSWSVDFIIAKTVERKFLKRNQLALATRTNSKGETVHIVEATDDDMLTKTNAHISKAARTAVLRLIPGDILDEAERQILETMKHQDSKDPAAAGKKLSSEFFALGITTEECETYIGQPMDKLTPANLAWMRSVLHTVKQGEGTWAEIVAAGSPSGKPPAAQPATGTSTEGQQPDTKAPPATATESLREKIQAKAGRVAPVSEASTAKLLDLVANPCFSDDERLKVENALMNKEKKMSETRALAWIGDLASSVAKRRAEATPEQLAAWDAAMEETSP